MNDRQIQVKIKLQNKEVGDASYHDDAQETAGLAEGNAAEGGEQDLGYTYNLPRISAALLLLVILVGLSFNYLSPLGGKTTGDSTGAALTETALTETTLTARSDPSNLPELASASTVVDGLNQLTAEAPPAATSLPQSVDEQRLPSEKHASSVADKPVEEQRVPEKTMASASKVLTDSSDQSAAASLPEEQTTTPEAAEELLKTAKVAVQSVTADSEKIHRATFAKTIQEKEPFGDGNSVVADNSGIAKLVFFTEVTGLKDEYITHNWFFQGKKVATIKIGVWADRYRCYSSKYLTKDKVGEWQVIVNDDQGKQLAEGSFHYLPSSS